MTAAAEEPRSMSSTPVRAVIAVLVFLAAIAVSGVRIRQKITSPNDQGNTLADFRDVIYYPTRAAVAGVNPYDSDRSRPAADGGPKYQNRYPAHQMFPLYSPLLFALFGLFALPPYNVAVCLWLLFNVALLTVWSYALWRMVGRRPTVEAVCYLAAAIMVLQSGRPIFVSGQTSLALALAVHGAVVWCRHRPLWAGAALALTSIKPTFGVPLGLTLLARRQWKTVAIGWGLGFLIGVAGLALIFGRAGDLGRVPEVLRSNQSELESDPDVDAQTSAVRIDSPAAWERLSGATSPAPRLFVFLLVAIPTLTAAFLLSRFPDDREAQVLADVVTFIAPVGMIYHLVYDGVTLWGAIVLLAFTPAERFRRVSPFLRYAILGSLVFTQVHCFATPTVRGWLDAVGISSRTMPAWLVHFSWTAVSVANGMALWIAILLILGTALRWQSATTSRRLG